MTGVTLPENLDLYISALMFVVGAYFIALYLGLIVWTFRDIHARSRDVLAQIMATLLVAVLTLPGLLIYLLLRPHETLAAKYERTLTEEALLQDLDEERVCPNCQHHVEADFVVCPYCHHQLRLRCVGCGRLLQPNWEVCPYCGLYQRQDALADNPGLVAPGKDESEDEEPGDDSLTESDPKVEAAESE
jgi:RNA polymerase subunit RPABC4/transcription elongation factor Spt4